MLQHFDTYGSETLKTKTDYSESEVKKIREHYKHVFLQGVSKPKLTAKKDTGELISVNSLIDDWGMANALYNKIIDHTYGKKKMNVLSLIKKGLQK